MAAAAAPPDSAVVDSDLWQVKRPYDAGFLRWHGRLASASSRVQASGIMWCWRLLKCSSADPHRVTWPRPRAALSPWSQARCAADVMVAEQQRTEQQSREGGAVPSGGGDAGSFDFKQYMKSRADFIDQALDKSVPMQYPELVSEAMRYPPHIGQPDPSQGYLDWGHRPFVRKGTSSLANLPKSSRIRLCHRSYAPSHSTEGIWNRCPETKSQTLTPSLDI